MIRKVKHEMSETAKQFSRDYSILVDGFELLPGDLFRVRGQHGAKFRFQSFVTNLRTGAQWVDCLEIVSNTPSVFRSFKLEQIKRIPNKGRRAKRVI